ncbi:MAG: hypothetical protein G01um101419_354 [Parcubacteria group bacterium Gr01-1014_19]|nr:MAG: hypothetical protein G01um101419_354 [Parcubacteria group bacterium Gr01-1014_19]
MRSLVAVIIVSLVLVVSAQAQDLSEFDNKKGTATVKTKCYVQDFVSGDTEEHLNFEHTRYYGVNGEIGSKISKSDDYTVEVNYIHEFDKDGRVVKRTKKETWAIGKGPTHTRATLVWEYTYDDSGAVTVVCKEVIKENEEDRGDPDAVKEKPIVETWKLDATGRVLRYSRSLGDKENFRVEFERDKDGKLLTKTAASGELVYSKETYIYRDDGTLKGSDELASFTMRSTKKQYDPIGKECAGQIVDKDGKTTRQWTVDRSVCGRMDPTANEDWTTYKIYGEDPEKLEMQVRYVVTTTTGK